LHTYVERSKTKREASIEEVVLRGASAKNNRNSASANNKYPRLGFEQAFSQYSYVWSVFGVFSHYCYSFPRFKTRTILWGWSPSVIFFRRNFNEITRKKN
jgi:hypothetical protein